MSGVGSGVAPLRTRDLRLDFFRGVALLFIFVDHIPSNVLSNFTLHNVGFSDAAEVFIFISGYTAGLVYGRIFDKDGPLRGTLRVWHRVWQLYMAHIFMFVLYIALVSYTMQTFSNPMYSEEMHVGDFLSEPHITIIRALTLEFQPTFLDILPLYIALLGFFPLLLLAVRCHWLLALVPAVILYAVVQRLGLPRLPAYAEGGTWFFNPFAWQLLFTIGALCGHPAAGGRGFLPQNKLGSKLLLAAAVAIVGFGVAVNLSWTLHRLYEPLPALLLGTFFPLSKTDLAPLRLVNFLALALVVERCIRSDHWLLRTRPAGMLVLCGQNALHIFCLSILLSLISHFILVEFDDRVPMQLMVTAVGALVLFAVAAFLDWFKSGVAGSRARPVEGVR